MGSLESTSVRLAPLKCLHRWLMKIAAPACVGGHHGEAAQRRAADRCLECAGSDGRIGLARYINVTGGIGRHGIGVIVARTAERGAEIRAGPMGAGADRHN
ncbi:MAG TPA: hypothetical protein VMB03_04785 [Bryobacteraceae bacterium]|nr:hypothetical protein [Bryobacteraceae bacterium]